jgi:polyhydroxybutyrate depolymerase
MRTAWSGVMLAIVLGALAGCSRSGGQPSDSTAASAAACSDIASDGELTVQSGGMARTAIVHLPPSGRGQAPYPVVLAFHWFGGTSAEMGELTAFSAKADAEGFIVAYPQALGQPPQWHIQSQGDVAFVGALLDRLEANGCADPARVYATGMSLGAAMSNVLGCRLADRIAAIGPVSGPYGPGWEGSCTPTRPVPVIAFHGVIDGTVPYAGGAVLDAGVPAIDTPPVVPAERWAAEWARRDGCTSGPVHEPAIGQVEPLVWEGCDAPVAFYRINDGGHSWPGTTKADPDVNRDVNATDLILSFFSAQALPGS